MITIIENGYFHNQYQFMCEGCGCVWCADFKDISITRYDGNDNIPCCYCPECNTWTAGEERDI